jgi:membrane associated rhomboid family serine protease
MNSIIQDLKYQFNKGDIIIRLVMLNVAIYLSTHLIAVPIFLVFGDASAYYSFITEWFWMPSDPLKLITRPWTLITHMFMHSNGLFHILFNMLWLYWFGRIATNYIQDRKLLSIYLLGGLLGGVLYLISYNIFPPFLRQSAVLVGASGSVMAIVLATATLNPKGTIRLFLLNISIELQYVALFVVVLDILQVPYSNAGGHLAHLGGAFMGWFFIYQLRRGRDLSAPIEGMIDWFRGKKAPKTRKKREPRMAYKKAHQASDSNAGMSGAASNYSEFSRSFAQKYRNMSKQECVDAILDKIRQSGYDSLTEDEKSFLDKSSKD